MAPEQLTREPVDARTDLYSMGCVFYEALSGRKAFDGENMADVIDKHIEHTIEPLHVIAPYVPAWLGAWCMRLMACRPDDRPADARMAIEEFRAWEKMPVAPMGPWMPMGYYMPTAAPYPQPGYEAQAADYYQQVPHITSSQVPVYLPPPVATQEFYAAPAEEYAQAVEVVEDVPVARRPSGPVRPAVPRAGVKTTLPSGSGVGGWKKWIFIGAGIAAAIGIAAFFMTSGKQTTVDSGGKAETTLIGPGGPVQVALQLPTDRQFPLVDHALAMHFVGNTGLLGHRKGADGKQATANANEPVLEWRDLASRANDNFLRTYNQSPDYSPRRIAWPQEKSHATVKGGRTCLDFRLRNGTPSAMNLTDPEQYSEMLPFGSDTAWKGGGYAPGLTVMVLFQANAGDLPTRVVTLLNDSGASASIRVDQGGNVVADLDGGGNKVSITSRDVDASLPVIVTVIWNKNQAEATLRVRDVRGKTFRSTPAKATTPATTLSKVQLGRVQKADGQGVSKEDSFSGFLGELLIYSMPLKPDQSDAVEGQLRSHYFQDPPKTPAKK
jgi:hypothetical protein